MIILVLVFLAVASAAILVALIFPVSSSHSRNHQFHQPPNPLYSFIRKVCPETRYSSLCYSTLSTMPVRRTSNDGLNAISFLDDLAFSINRTASNVETTRAGLGAHFTHQDLRAQEKNAYQDCMELLDQTVYELQQAVQELGSSSLQGSYSGVKTLLSAAMTNENTCINGFLDLEQIRSRHRKDHRHGHVEHLQTLLTPISEMISNSLALIKLVETKNQQRVLKKPNFMINKFRNNYSKTVYIRKKKLRQAVTVASNGSGNYTSIGKAVAMAPSTSPSTYRIRIMSGIYRENVVIPREKINIMLIGDGMNSTIITGSRNFADGFSTFESATLTVVGDKFLAQDLTIENTAAPDKHQAVALRVTSNAALYRCRIISHQDTLYAHSLSQLYRECLIQGTVDFIFGNAAAVFQNCAILVRKPIPGQRNMITAQGREDPNQNTGIILQNCTIEAAEDFDLAKRKSFPTYLGRPWRNYSRTVVVNSYLGDLIHPRGWFEWDEHSNLDTVEYIEYMNSGPGADTRSRISWAGYRKNCSEDVVRQFRPEEFLHGADEWLESIVFPLFTS